jgi:hypothetical protein
MAKLDDVFAAFEAGFTNPQTNFYTAVVEDAALPQMKLRRRDASRTHERVWILSVGEAGAPPFATFYGYKPSDCVKKASEWRGLPTITRGPRANGQPQQAD